MAWKWEQMLFRVNQTESSILSMPLFFRQANCSGSIKSLTKTANLFKTTHSHTFITATSARLDKGHSWRWWQLSSAPGQCNVVFQHEATVSVLKKQVQIRKKSRKEKDMIWASCSTHNVRRRGDTLSGPAALEGLLFCSGRRSSSSVAETLPVRFWRRGDTEYPQRI